MGENHCLAIFLGLLGRYPRGLNIPFTTVYRHPSTNYSRTMESIPGHEVLSLMKKGFVVKIFERLKVGLKRIGMSKTKYLKGKIDLFEEYQFPQPFPPDMMLKRPMGRDQGYLILGQQGTGKVQQ